MSEAVFDPLAFGEMVRVKMARERLSCRELATKTGVSSATINRVSRGNPPDIETFLRLSRWLGWRWRMSAL